MAIKTIGFIGIGNMGSAHGHQSGEAAVTKLVVFDADGQRAPRSSPRMSAPNPRASLAALGAEVRPHRHHAADRQRCAHVLVETDRGALAANLPRVRWCRHELADPVSARARPDADLAKRGVSLVDAPVSGGVPRATDGRSPDDRRGDEPAVATAQPALAKMGKRLFEAGDPRQRPRDEGAQQFRRRHRVHRGAEAVPRRPAASGSILRCDDRRDERLDRTATSTPR